MLSKGKYKTFYLFYPAGTWKSGKTQGCSGSKPGGDLPLCNDLSQKFPKMAGNPQFILPTSFTSCAVGCHLGTVLPRTCVLLARVSGEPKTETMLVEISISQ